MISYTFDHIMYDITSDINMIWSKKYDIIHDIIASAFLMSS
jgi:hypothetical protein